MKKVLVVGAGAQGGPCAAILAKHSDVAEIRLGDINPKILKRVCERVYSNKLKPIQLDASKTDALCKAAEGVDVIINLNMVSFNHNVLTAAVETGTHYVDTANDYEYLKKMVNGIKPLQFDEEFKKKGKTALMGCGLTPGVSNVLTRYMCNQMEEIEKICIRMGYYHEPPESEDIVKIWAPTWSPEIALSDYAEKPLVFECGEYKTVPIFSRHEYYPFANPVGKVLIASHSHEEPYTLPYYIGKGLKFVDFKYPIDPIAGAFIKMGFAEDKKIDVEGVKVVPMDVLMKMVRRPANTFLDESVDSIKNLKAMACEMEINVQGIQDGKKTSGYISYKTIFNQETRTQLYNTLGTSYSRVALPVVVGANLCINGETDPGVISSECLDTAKFFKLIAEMGCPIEFEEKRIRQIKV